MSRSVTTFARALALLALPALLPVACRGPAADGSQAGGWRPGASIERPPLTVGGSEFRRRRLSNGLEAIAVDCGETAGGAGKASVFVVYGVGKRMEGPLTSGLAHLVEHAMYIGTGEVGDDEHDAIVKGLGGQSNAYTREDFTLYYDYDLPLKALERVLALEADRMRGIVWDEQAFLDERSRLEHEEAATGSDSDRRAELVESALFRRHPYGAGVLDEQLHTRAPYLPMGVARAFYDTWYHPDRAAVVVAADLDPEAALDAIERAFAGLPPGPKPPPFPVEEPSAGGEARFDSTLSSERVVCAWVGPALREDGSLTERAALDLLAKLVVRAAREAGDPADCTMGGRVDRDLFTLEANGDGAAERLAALLARVLERELETDAFDEERERLAGELDERPLLGRPYFALAGVVGIHAALGEPDLASGYAAAVRALSREDVRAAAARWLASERAFIVRFLPGGTSGEELPEDPRELQRIADNAAASGDLERAIRAYEKLVAGTDDRKWKVIYGYSLADLRIKAGDLLGAKSDLEAALAVVDYPAVRELLEEVERRLAEGRGASELEPASRPAEGREGPASRPAAAPPAGAASDAQKEGAALPPSGRRAVVVGGERPALAAVANELMAEIETWRGLAFRSDLEVELVPEEEAAEKLKGWYEPDTGRLVVVDTGSDTFARGTMLHEMFHALQDQHFDLGALHESAGDEDAQRALSALIEGEAMLCVAEVMDYDFEQHLETPAEGELDESRFEKMFLYGEGLRFVRALREAGGWERVSRAFQEPPTATAQIYHPERYLAEKQPAALEAGVWLSPVEIEGALVRPFGEYDLRLLLSRAVATRPDAARFGAALGGGTLVERPEGARPRRIVLLFLPSEQAGALAARAEELGGGGRILDSSGRIVRLDFAE